MDRLTYRDGHGEAWYSGGTPADHLHRLADYEDLEMTPEDIEQTMLNFSSFLMEMTGGRMSKTNYTVQAMVAVANDYQQQELDKERDEAYDLGVESVLRNHFDIPWDEAADLRKNIDHLRELMAAEKEGRLRVLPCKVGDTIYAIPSKVNRELNVINRHPENNRVYTQTVQEISFFQDGVYLLKCCDGLQMHHSQFFRETWFLTQEEAEAALAKDNNVPTKEEE